MMVLHDTGLRAWHACNPGERMMNQLPATSPRALPAVMAQLDINTPDCLNR